MPAIPPLLKKFSWSTFAGLSPGAAEPPALGRFVFLSMLLHFLLIVLFGNTTGTGTAPGAYLLDGRADLRGKPPRLADGDVRARPVSGRR